MRSSAVLVVVLALAACGTQPTPEAASTNRAAIIGGTLDPGDPAVLVLRIENPGGTSLCTATVIGPLTALTAGHCTADLEPGGTLHLIVDGEPVAASLPATFPGYAPARPYDRGDLGLVHLSHPLPGPFPTLNRYPLERLPLFGRPVRFVGYGLTGDGGFGAKREVTSTTAAIASLTELSESNDRALTCGGDSGGPGFFTAPDGVESLISVTSRGDPACARRALVTRVDPFLDFIADYLSRTGDAPSCALDGRCGFHCTEPDPDCPCAPDGLCAAACADPAADLDCPASCLFDGGSCLTPPLPATPPAPGQTDEAAGCSASGFAGPSFALFALLGLARSRRIRRPGA